MDRVRGDPGYAVTGSLAASTTAGSPSSTGSVVAAASGSAASIREPAVSVASGTPSTSSTLSARDRPDEVAAPHPRRAQSRSLIERIVGSVLGKRSI